MHTPLANFVASDKEDNTRTTVSGTSQPMADVCCNNHDKLDVKVTEQDDVIAVPSPAQIIFSLTISMLVRRGSLNADERVSKYWPEYIAKGGKDVGIQQLLSVDPSAMSCGDLVTIEDVSEFVRRAEGRSLEEFTAEVVTGSLKIDLHQRVSVAQEQQSDCTGRLPCSTNSFGRSDVGDGHTSSNGKKLYPSTVPPHHLHPYAQDFAVVDQSPIGKALLTYRRWQQGDFMARFDGVTVPEVMLHTLQKTSQIHLWDPYFIGNLAHSCKPNVMLDMAEHEMWALQDIEPGTVLSMDYASTEDYLFRTFECECHASGCRGEITGRKQRRSGYASTSSKSI